MDPTTIEVNPATSDLANEGTPPGSPSWHPGRKHRAVGIALFFILAFAFVLFLGFRGKATLAPGAATKSVQASVSGRSLRLKGVTEAIRMRAILAPVLAGQFVATLTITKLTAAGTHVKQGDLLVEFDRQSQIRNLMDKQAEYEKLVSQVSEEQAKEDTARAKDETEIQQAEDALGKAQLEMQKVEIVSQIDAEKAGEDLEEAQATLTQLRKTFALKRKAGRAAVRILEIQRDRTQQIMLHAQTDATLMQIRSPLDGVVVLSTIWKQGEMGEVQEGDQLRPGIPFMEVVDPSVMQVRALANQEDFLRLRVGQSVRIHLDAYPDLVFPGKLEEMAPIGQSGSFSSRLRTFTVVFSIAGQDVKLMPDLSAAVDVDLSGQNTTAAELR